MKPYVNAMMEGKCFGTMCLSEPQAGSSLADIRTRAIKTKDGRYRLFGNKMWISGGEHDISDNIVHLVLAKFQMKMDNYQQVCQAFLCLLYRANYSMKMDSQANVTM